jgi:hypothetical protein
MRFPSVKECSLGRKDEVSQRSDTKQTHFRAAKVTVNARGSEANDSPVHGTRRLPRLKCLRCT